MPNIVFRVILGLRVHWAARRSNRSILQKIHSDCSLEGLILKLKRQYFGHLMWRANSLEKPWCWERLKAGGEVDDRGWDGWMASLTHWTWVWANSRRWWGRGRPVCCNPWDHRVGHDWRTGQQQAIQPQPKRNISRLNSRACGCFCWDLPTISCPVLEFELVSFL